jgi:hypothetical protein
MNKLYLQIVLYVQSLYSYNLFVKKMKCEHIFRATEASFLPNAPIQNRSPDSRFYALARPHCRCRNSFVWISCCRSRHRLNLISVSSVSHHQLAHLCSQSWRALAVRSTYLPNGLVQRKLSRFVLTIRGTWLESQLCYRLSWFVFRNLFLHYAASSFFQLICLSPWSHFHIT